MKLKIVIAILIVVMLISGCFLAWSLGTHNPSSYAADSGSSLEQIEWFTHSLGSRGNVQHSHHTVIEK